MNAPPLLRTVPSLTVARTQVSLAALSLGQGHLRDAAALLRHALPIYRDFMPVTQYELAAALRLLGTVLLKRDAYADAEATLREALAMQRTLRPADPAAVVAILLGLERA